MSTDAPRWEQRFEAFERALRRLEAACQQTSYTELEQAGMVQTFEFTFELAWKTLEDILAYEGLTVKTPREAIRQAFATGYLTEDETETLLAALGKRNVLAHTYDEAMAELAIRLIKDDYAPVLSRLYTKLKTSGPGQLFGDSE